MEMALKKPLLSSRTIPDDEYPRRLRYCMTQPEPLGILPLKVEIRHEDPAAGSRHHMTGVLPTNGVR